MWADEGGLSDVNSRLSGGDFSLLDMNAGQTEEGSHRVILSPLCTSVLSAAHRGWVDLNNRSIDPTEDDESHTMKSDFIKCF